MNTNEDILYGALTKLTQNTGQALIHRGDVLKFADREEVLGFAIKRHAAQADANAIGVLLDDCKQPAILVADFINPNMAQRLVETNVQFIDVAGNAYINVPGLYVQITGRKNQNPQTPKTGGVNRAFNQAGLRVIFALLCRPGLLKVPQREIAEATGVALGTVHQVMRGLLDAGYLLRKNPNATPELTDHKKLLNRFTQEYLLRLRPKLHLGDFQAAQTIDVLDIDLAKFGAYWGGEEAGGRYTDGQAAQNYVIYVPREKKAELLERARLKAIKGEVAAGRVTLLERFWNPDQLDVCRMDLAPAALVYADLMLTGEINNKETAKMLFAP